MGDASYHFFHQQAQARRPIAGKGDKRDYFCRIFEVCAEEIRGMITDSPGIFTIITASAGERPLFHISTGNTAGQW